MELLGYIVFGAGVFFLSVWIIGHMYAMIDLADAALPDEDATDAGANPEAND